MNTGARQEMPGRRPSTHRGFSLIGYDQAGKRRNKVYIAQSSRTQGLYILGSTGQGKTGLIENLIVQDVEQGTGICLLDPHGDLTRKILGRIPQDREKDVIFLDIGKEAYPFGLNLFACQNPRSSKAVQYVVDQVMHIFEKLFDLSRATPRMAQYLRNCTHTLIVNPGYTMAEIPLLLTDEEFRNRLLANVTDPQVLLFWQQYEQMRPTDRKANAESTLNKLDEFLQPLPRNIVGQARTTIDFRKVMDEGKILLIMLDARLSSITSLIGSMVVALLLNAAYSRSSGRREQFHIYADEFHRFATEDFATLLTEARKFGIGTTIAHQMRDQLDRQNRSATLTVANLVIFQVSGKDADELKVEFEAKPQSTEPRLEPILTPVTDPIGYLCSGKGHPNPLVTRFVQTTLFPFYQFVQGYHPQQRPLYQQTITGPQQSYNELNREFHSAMMRKSRKIEYTSQKTLEDLASYSERIEDFRWCLHVLKQEHAKLSGLGNFRWVKYNNFSYIFLDAPFLARALGEATYHYQFGRREDLQDLLDEWEKSPLELRQQVYQEAQNLVTFLQEIFDVRLALYREPIMQPSGQYEEKPGPPEPISNAQNRIANELANLPRFTARVKIAEGKRTGEYTVQTDSPQGGLYGRDLKERIRRIQRQNIAERYLRLKDDVEQEIRNRQNGDNQEPPSPSPAEIPPSPPPGNTPAPRQQRRSRQEGDVPRRIIEILP